MLRCCIARCTNARLISLFREHFDHMPIMKRNLLLKLCSMSPCSWWRDRRSQWARRRKIEFVELLEAPWVMPEYENPAGSLIADGFRSVGIPPLKARVVSNSLAIRIRLVETRGFLTMLPGSMLHFGANRLPVKALPITLPIRSQPYEIVTLKNRTLSPVAKTFIECLRIMAKPLTKGRHRPARS